MTDVFKLKISTSFDLDLRHDLHNDISKTSKFR